MTNKEAITVLEAEVQVYESMVSYNRDFEPKNDNTALIRKIESLSLAIRMLKQDQSLVNNEELQNAKAILETLNTESLYKAKGIRDGLLTAEKSIDFAIELQKYGSLEKIRDACEKQNHSRYAIKLSGVYPYQCPTCKYKLEIGYKRCINCGQLLKYENPEKD